MPATIYQSTGRLIPENLNHKKLIIIRQREKIIHLIIQNISYIYYRKKIIPPLETCTHNLQPLFHKLQLTHTAQSASLLNLYSTFQYILSRYIIRGAHPRRLDFVGPQYTSRLLLVTIQAPTILR